MVTCFDCSLFAGWFGIYTLNSFDIVPLENVGSGENERFINNFFSLPNRIQCGVSSKRDFVPSTRECEGARGQWPIFSGTFRIWESMKGSFRRDLRFQFRVFSSTSTSRNVYLRAASDFSPYVFTSFLGSLRPTSWSSRVILRRSSFLSYISPSSCSPSTTTLYHVHE